VVLKGQNEISEVVMNVLGRGQNEISEVVMNVLGSVLALLLGQV